MNRNTLADSPIDWIVNVQLFEIVVAGVEHWKNTDHTIMVNFVVSKVKLEEFIVGEE